MIGRYMPVLASLSVCALCACGGGGGSSSAVPSSGGSSTSAYVRFVNDSPYANDPSSVSASTANPLTISAAIVDGTTVATLAPSGLTGLHPRSSVSEDAAAASASSYVAIPASAHSVSFANAEFGTVQAKSLGPYTLPALTAGQRYTAVLAGESCTNTLQLEVFIDPASSATPTLEVYNTAPVLNASYAIGVYGAAAAPASAQSVGTVAAGGTIDRTMPSALTTGFGIVVTPVGGSTAQTILPAAIDANDSVNALPFNTDTSIAVFIGDPATAAQPGQPCPPATQNPSVFGALGQ